MDHAELRGKTQPFLQVRHNCLVYYELPILKYSKNSSNLTGAYSGKVTGGVQKRIRSAVDLLIQKSPKRTIYNPVIRKNHSFTLNFVTLTISDPINRKSSETYQTVLKPFLRKMRSYTSNKVSYVWKAELQKRGQIHYHITSNQFLHLSWIRDTWNNLQRKARYLDHYASIHKNYNANSTDVHSVYKVKDIAAYLEKYLSKTDNSALLDSKVWDCSKDLKQKRFTFTPDNSDLELLERQIERKELVVVELEHCKIVKCKNVKLLLQNDVINEYQNYIA